MLPLPTPEILGWTVFIVPLSFLTFSNEAADIMFTPSPKKSWPGLIFLIFKLWWLAICEGKSSIPCYYLILLRKSRMCPNQNHCKLSGKVLTEIIDFTLTPVLPNFHLLIWVKFLSPRRLTVLLWVEHLHFAKIHGYTFELNN